MRKTVVTHREICTVLQGRRAELLNLCPMTPAATQCIGEWQYQTPDNRQKYPKIFFKFRIFSNNNHITAGPTVWNSLPDNLRNPAVGPDQFRRNLKPTVCLLLAFHWQCVRCFFNLFALYKCTSTLLCYPHRFNLKLSASAEADYIFTLLVMIFFIIIYNTITIIIIMIRWEFTWRSGAVLVGYCASHRTQSYAHSREQFLHVN